jgi:transposase
VLLSVLMSGHTDRPQVSRLEIVETGRRRRWSEAEKLRIVEESLSGRRMVSATARAHGISRSLLTTWRKVHREGRLGGDAAPSFAPVIVADPAPTTVVSRPGPRADRVEIVLVSGRRLLIDSGIEPATLIRLVQVLERA